MRLTAQKIVNAMEQLGYKLFKGDKNPNLIGIRSADKAANTFNDVICLLYQNDKEKWVLKQFPATTDAGLFYRKNPLNVDGTAVLCTGQHLSLWTLGYHQGKYQALVQNQPVSVWRDPNKDDQNDTGGELQKGWFGINLHRASADKVAQHVDKFSAGCQVIQHPNHYQQLMKFLNESVKNYGKTFTYTLLDESKL